MNEKEFYDRSDLYQRRSGRQDRMPSLWRRIMSRHTEDRFERIVRNLERGVSCLDVGCGEGELAEKVAPLFDEIHCVDIADARLESVRRRLQTANKRVNVVASNLNEALPFDDASMDAVTAISVLEHLFDVYSFVRECRRILKSRGILVLEVPNVAYFKNRIRLLFGALPITSSPHGWAEGFGWDGGHLHYFTKPALVDLLEREGFTVSEITESRASFPGLRSKWVSLLAGNFLVKAVKS